MDLIGLILSGMLVSFMYHIGYVVWLKLFAIYQLNKHGDFVWFLAKKLNLVKRDEFQTIAMNKMTCNTYTTLPGVSVTYIASCMYATIGYYNERRNVTSKDVHCSTCKKKISSRERRFVLCHGSMCYSCFDDNRKSYLVEKLLLSNYVFSMLPKELSTFINTVFILMHFRCKFVLSCSVDLYIHSDKKLYEKWINRLHDDLDKLPALNMPRSIIYNGNVILKWSSINLCIVGDKLYVDTANHQGIPFKTTFDALSYINDQLVEV